MTRKHLVGLMLCTFFPLCLFAQNLPVPSPGQLVQDAPDAGELTTLLRGFLAGASRNEVAVHERFWADDLIYTGSTGRRNGKADILREVRAESAKPAEGSANYSAEDIRILQYGPTAVVAFRLVNKIRKGEETEVTNYLNTGTFVKRAGRWQVVSWQSTKVPDDSQK